MVLREPEPERVAVPERVLVPEEVPLPEVDSEESELVVDEALSSSEDVAEREFVVRVGVEVVEDSLSFWLLFCRLSRTACLSKSDHLHEAETVVKRSTKARMVLKSPAAFIVAGQSRRLEGCRTRAANLEIVLG